MKMKGTTATTGTFRSLLLAMALPTLVGGAASLSEYGCDPAHPALCGTAEFYSPSPAALENGTTFYIGGYSYIYHFYPAGLEGADLTGTANYTEVAIGRDDSNVCTGISVDGTNCTRCVFCGNETFTADCTNIPNGRLAVCESVAYPSLYFPLTDAAIAAPASPVAAASDFPSSTPTGFDMPSDVPSNIQSSSPSDVPSMLTSAPTMPTGVPVGMTAPAPAPVAVPPPVASPVSPPSTKAPPTTNTSSITSAARPLEHMNALVGGMVSALAVLSLF
jgi:hypothetical protein